MSGLTIVWTLCLGMAFFNAVQMGKSVVSAFDLDDRKWKAITIGLWILNLVFAAFCGYMLILSTK